MRTRRKLLKSRTFRLVLVYVSLFAVALAALLGWLYTSTSSSVTRQIDATIDAEITGLAEQYYQLGTIGLQRAIDRRVADDKNGRAIYLLAGPDFRRLAGNLKRWPTARPDSEGWVNFAIKVAGAKGEDERFGRARIFRLGGRVYLLVGHDIRERIRVAAQIEEALIGGLAAILALTLLGALLVSRALLRRIDAINTTSREIVAGDLSRRIPVSGSNDEFDQLAGNLNAMLEQNQTLLIGMKQVTDNIAHDLRSPLGRLRTRLEGLLSGKAGKAETRREIERAIAEADDLLKTFSALLSIAQIEAGTERGRFETVDLGEVVRDIAELYQPLAEDKGLELTQTGAGQPAPPAPVRGNRDLLSQALANLADNAIKYTPAGGKIHLDLRRDGGRLILVVRDNGPGIPAEARTRVLDRFYRLESSRSTPGSGLGLSLAAAVTKLHDGTLTLDDNAPGLIVRLSFPPDPSEEPTVTDRRRGAVERARAQRVSP